MSQPDSDPVRLIPTPHGPVAAAIRQVAAPASSSPSAQVSLLLLHSNSSSGRSFHHILSQPPPGVCQVIAIDFLGHGQSPDASGILENAYTMRGYAESAVAVLSALAVSDVIVFGWSLGGHVAIEMIPQLAATKKIRCRGIMITGTPPANGADEVSRGFDVSTTNQLGDEAAAPAPDQHAETKTESDGAGAQEGDGEENVGLGAAENWREGDAELFSTLVHGPPNEPWQAVVAKRTDGRARKIMFKAFRSGTELDQRKTLETFTDVPCAVVNGAKEPFVNLDYVDAIKYGNLWEGQCHRIPGLGHAPFWEQPQVFQEYLWRFVRDCTSDTA